MGVDDRGSTSCRGSVWSRVDEREVVPVRRWPSRDSVVVEVVGSEVEVCSEMSVDVEKAAVEEREGEERESLRLVR